MGMIVVMIRWVCFIDHAFKPTTPPAHNAPGRWPASQAATTAATAAGQLACYRWAKNRPPT
ncbi:hypothetical protein [Corynebacterium matruchotii]|uniref:hypothetical protein n=1 Tax=Corynebacterium matruchotii TaxID=43768 RepID=UPI0028EBA5D6|nr:hypothetical protein [Corynebacterium matruchotii]